MCMCVCVHVGGWEGAHLKPSSPYPHHLTISINLYLDNLPVSRVFGGMTRTSLAHQAGSQFLHLLHSLYEKAIYHSSSTIPLRRRAAYMYVILACTSSMLLQMHNHIGWPRLVRWINGSLLQNIVSFIGLFCTRDL